MRAALDGFGRIDALVNDADTLRNARLEDFAREDRDAMSAVHLGGPFNATQAIWSYLTAQRHQRIVFTPSAADMLGNPTQSAHGAWQPQVFGFASDVGNTCVAERVPVTR